MIAERVEVGVPAPEWVPLPRDMIAPSSWRGEIECQDECGACPLYIRGCGRECVCWSDVICEQCPCLGSAYARWLVAALSAENREPEDVT
jgi:hypothetical protein